MHLFCFPFIQGRGHHMINGLVHHSSHDKDENSVTLAMQRITLMGPRYAERTCFLKTDAVLTSWHLKQTPGNPVHHTVSE